jgi:hypothetical protein
LRSSRSKKERPNLFDIYHIEPWTPRDARRKLTTFMDDRRLGGAATAILGHKTDHDRVDERERMASVTEQHYNRSQRIGLEFLPTRSSSAISITSTPRRSRSTRIIPRIRSSA